MDSTNEALLNRYEEKDEGDATPQINDDEATEEEEYKMYSSRWIALAVYALGSLANAMIWISFAPIATVVSHTYSVNNTAVNMLSVIFMILYIPGTYLASYLFKRFGLRGTILAANTLNVAGSVLRFASIVGSKDSKANNGGYALLLIGQGMCGLVQPIFVNAAALIAATWFALEQRDLATVIASMANPIGTGVGQILPAMLVNEEGSGMSSLLLIQFAISGSILLLAYFLFLDKPPTPPSYTETLRYSHRISDQSEIIQDGGPFFWHQISSLLKNRNFIKLAFGFSIGLAYFNSLATVLGQQVNILGYTDNDAGIFGALILGFGLIGCAIVGPIMDATHRYKTILKTFSVMTFVTVLALCGSLRPNNHVALLIIFSVLGFFVLPLLPLSFECMVECTYPVSEEVTNGIMLSMGNILSIGITFAWQSLIEKTSSYRGVYVSYNFLQVGIFVVCGFFILSFNGNYNRLNAEKAYREVSDRNRTDKSKNPTIIAKLSSNSEKIQKA
mmetsp:Transcript_29087/g.49311  ORF Transcript_29087/g.49311 Transcript_29087/m.49311 type:complete len:504 (+) Transcript_29087:117-1628(+)